MLLGRSVRCVLCRERGDQRAVLVSAQVISPESILVRT
jgi:hypothetical protein